jgi:diguanylate cyclase (GGDEF)-like protein
MVLLDFDHFKSINDTQGHQAGDAVLENVGRRIKAMIGPNDLAARYGGEEIAIILKNISPMEALDIAEQMRKAIGTNPVPFDANTIQITASFGVATMDSANIFDSFDELIGAADRGLYAAKEAGRNCCRSVSNVLNQTCVNGIAQTQTPAAA